MRTAGIGSWLWKTGSFLALLLATTCSPGSRVQDGRIVIRSGSFTFPALASVMAPVIQAQKFDEAHGLRLEIVEYGSVSAYYAALAVGEVDTVPGGPLILQKMRSQGVPVTITNTYAGLASLLVIGTAPRQTLSDLGGGRLAADLSSSEYQILRLISSSQGLSLGEDIEVIQAVPSVARAHLESGQADAMLTFEPQATLAMSQLPDLRVILSGKEGWRKLTGSDGWLLVSMVREDWLERFPGAERLWIATLQDAAQFIRDNPEQADRIVSEALDLPPGIFQRALSEGRIEFDIRPAPSEEEALGRMFGAALESGFVDRLPAAGAIFGR